MDTTSGLEAILPALAFLCLGVPLAALLDRLGLFDAVATEIIRRHRPLPVGALWLLAAATTAVLNLDTTIVLLTPLAIRLARHADVDPLPVALVPLLLASFASSVLPISNLTTLIAVERYDLTTIDVLTHLAPVSIAATTVGWIAYRRRHPTVLHAPAPTHPPDVRALRTGGAVVAGLLVGFIAGPSLGIDAWVVVAIADLVLIALTRWIPWRDVPVATAAGVAAIAAVVWQLAPTSVGDAIARAHTAPALAATVAVGAAAANAVNNLPALLIALDGGPASPTWGTWAWLAGLNTGAALLPLGALANLLWWRILRDEGVPLSLRRYAAETIPIVIPALAAGALALLATAAIIG